MSSLAILVASFLAALTLASPVARQASICPWNGVPNASNFTLLSVSKTETSVQKPLALGLNGLPAPSSVAWLGVFTPFFWSLRLPSEINETVLTSIYGTQSVESIHSIVAQNFVMTDGGITAYASDGGLVGVSNLVANESGRLSFLRPDEGVTVAPAEVYCELVSSELEGPHDVKS